MKSWEQDVLQAFQHCQDGEQVLQALQEAATWLGFDYCAYGLRTVLPSSSPRTLMVNNYPEAWRLRYRDADYLRADPTVLHCRRSHLPILWSNEVFERTPALWADARAVGLRVGWAQSCLDGFGVGGMLTLARGHEPLSGAELASKEARMAWLVHVLHHAMKKVLHPLQVQAALEAPLTARETDVLRWTADGKTAQEISNIMSISTDTVNFHIKKATVKLKSANKTAAVVRAVVLGLLN